MSGISSTYNPKDRSPIFRELAGETPTGTPGNMEVVFGKDDYGCEFKVYGATSGSYMQWDESADTLILTNAGISLTEAALGATNDRMMKLSGTQATPAMQDGYGVIEKELTVSGTATAQVCLESSWINLGTDATIPSYAHIHNDGFYDATATLTNAYVAWAKYQCILSSNPARCSLWELNFSGANSEVDALFSVNSLTLALGYQAGTPTKAAVGSIPFVIDSNDSIKYIYLYDAADSD